MSSIRAAALLTIVLLAAVACGGDDGGSESADGGGDPEAFCDRLVELDDADELDLEDDEALAALDELVELAPDEIDSDLTRIQEALEELVALEEDGGEDAFGAAFEIVLDPRFNSSLEDFAEYADDECGVEVEGADDFDDLSGDLSSDFSSDFSDDLTEDDLSPAQELRAFLDENHPDFSDLASGIGIAQVGDSELQVTLTLDETTDDDTAVAICEATLDFGEDAELEAIEVEVEDQEDIVLATGDLDGGCEAA
jgi:hypothetical protein